MAPLVYVLFQSGSLANGGVESATQILERLKIPRIVVTQREGEATERFRRAGCDVRVWSDEGPTRSRALRWNEDIRVLCRANGVRVVHCNDIAAFWHAAIGARAASAKVIFNVRDIFEEGRRYGPRWRLIHHLASEIVCLSEDMCATMAARFPPQLPGLPRALVSYTYSAIDLERMRPVSGARKAELREALGLAREGFEIAYVGGVCDKKNQLGFLEGALPKLMRDVPAARVSFVGDFTPDSNPYAKRCLDAAQPWIDEGRVRFLGFVPGTERVYQAADLVVLASRYEGLPRCMIESLACGTPVVAFEVTSARELLEAQRTGFVTARYDYVAMVDAIARLAGDEVLLAELGARAREVAVRAFDPALRVAEYARRYERWAAPRTLLPTT